jgi:flagellar biogenesis protein FliO
MVVFSVIGSLGGIVTFIGAVWLLLRGIIHQQDAVKENTTAITNLTTEIHSLTDKVGGHDTRLSVLEDWRKGIRR